VLFKGSVFFFFFHQTHKVCLRVLQKIEIIKEKEMWATNGKI